MSKGMIIFAILTGWTLIIHGGLTYLIVKKKEYSLISGFFNRPEEEQKYLIEQGYIEKFGNVMKQSFFILLAAFLLTLFRVPYGAAVGFSVFTLHILIGIFYITKFEVPQKRKKYRWIIGSISFGTIAFIGGLLGYGYMENEVTITDDTFEISGMYGIEWDIDDIIDVQLLEELPVVEIRTNGISASNLLKGRFRLEDPYGTGTLFVKRNLSPYLYVATEENYLILNRDTRSETEEIYKKLMEKR